MQHREEQPGNASSLDGLWLVLIEEKEPAAPTFEGRVPMVARTDDEETFLLGFKNAQKARQFLETSNVAGAEPRLVVKSNKDAMLRVAKASGVIGVLVDYDPKTSAYSSAAEL